MICDHNKQNESPPKDDAAVRLLQFQLKASSACPNPKMALLMAEQKHSFQSDSRWQSWKAEVTVQNNKSVDSETRFYLFLKFHSFLRGWNK